MSLSFATSMYSDHVASSVYSSQSRWSAHALVLSALSLYETHSRPPVNNSGKEICGERCARFLRRFSMLPTFDTQLLVRNIYPSFWFGLCILTSHERNSEMSLSSLRRPVDSAFLWHRLPGRSFLFREGERNSFI